jgi:hypothetical protein
MNNMTIKQDLGHWDYVGDPFDFDKYFGFIYMIQCTHPDNPTRYIGRKQFHMYSKGKDRRVSNWKTYSSSSKHINNLIKELGTEHFTFEMLQLFETRGGLSAGEVKVQWYLDVLTQKYANGNPVFLNRQIGAIKFIPKEEIDDETIARLDRVYFTVREEQAESRKDSEETSIEEEKTDDKEP